MEGVGLPAEPEPERRSVGVTVEARLVDRLEAIAQVEQQLTAEGRPREQEDRRGRPSGYTTARAPPARPADPARR